MSDRSIEAMVALRSRDWPRARAAAESVLAAIDRNDEPDAWLESLFVSAVAMAAMGELDAAQDRLGEVLEEQPWHVDAWYNLGHVHGQRGEPEAALACYRAALAADPANHAVLFHEGQTLERLGRSEEALTAYRQAVSRSPNPGDVWGYRGTDFTKPAQEAIARLSR